MTFRVATSTYQLALRFTCPKCSAKPGHSCRGEELYAGLKPGRRYTGPRHHQERRKEVQSWRHARGWR